MFERYTEGARRSIFFARYEAAQAGSPWIEVGHVFLGVLREARGLVVRLIGDEKVEALALEIREVFEVGAADPKSGDLPLSNESKGVLSYAAEDAEKAGHRHIGVEHLLLGLLREPDSKVARIAARHGLERARVWDEVVSGRIDQSSQGLPPAADRQGLHALVDSLPETALSHALSTLMHLQVRRAPPPEPPRIAEIREQMRERMRQSIRPGMGMAGGMGGGWKVDSEGRLQDGHFTSSRIEDGATLIETHRFYRGHEITLIERLRLSEDGKALHYSQEIHGPKRDEAHSLDFDVS